MRVILAAFSSIQTPNLDKLTAEEINLDRNMIFDQNSTMIANLSPLNEALKMMHDLTAHSLSIWNFFWVVCLAVLGFVITDKGGYFQHPLSRLILSVGFVAFAIGNYYVLERATKRHEMCHRFLEEYPSWTSSTNDISRPSPDLESTAPNKPEVQTFIAEVAKATRPSPAIEVMRMHGFLASVILVLIWFVPWMKARTSDTMLPKPKQADSGQQIPQ